jgi:hypothetical protein
MLLTSLPQIRHAPIAPLGTSLGSFHFAERSDLARESSMIRVQRST